MFWWLSECFTSTGTDPHFHCLFWFSLFQLFQVLTSSSIWVMRWHQSAALCWNARWTSEIFLKKDILHSFKETPSHSVVTLLRRTSGRQHEEGHVSAVVQRRTRDQSWQQPRLHRGSPETGNSAGKSWGKEPCVTCGFMYICIFLYCPWIHLHIWM